METKRYRTSRFELFKTASSLFIVLLLITALGFANSRSFLNIVGGVTLCWIAFGFILFSVSKSYVEIDQGDLILRNYGEFPFTRKVAISSIRKVFFPSQNELSRLVAPFLFVVYVDKNSGAEKLLKIPRSMFGDRTLSDIAKQLRRQKNDIELGAELI